MIMGRAFQCAALLAALLPAVARAEPAAHPEIAAWDRLMDSLKRSGQDFLAAAPATDPVTRAEALRYLNRQLGLAITRVQSQHQPHPVLRLTTSDIAKTGFDAAEAKYLSVPVDSAGTYRVWGRLGSATHIALQLYALPNPMVGAAILGDELKPAADGSFELLIASTRPVGWTGPWLPMVPTDTELYIREYFDDWANETPSEWQMERLDQGGDNAPFDRARALKLADNIAQEFATRLPLWLKQVERIRGDGGNHLAPATRSALGLGDNSYGNGWFNLGPGEALLIEFDAPDARLWSWELGNLWWESLDYVNHTASLTGAHARRSTDGRYRLIVAGSDPGFPNWLDTAGHREGAIMYRYIFGRKEPVPTLRKVAIQDLPNLLPQDTPRVTPEQRAGEIALRRRHIAARFAP